MSTPSALESLMLDLVNQERAERGISPLAFDLLLNASSEDHSDWMQSSGQFSHTGQGGSSATARMRDAGFELQGSWRTAENIAYQSERGAAGYEDDVAQLHDALMNSPGHRANILNPSMESIGIGIETGASAFGRFDAVIVTQNFATSSAPNAPYNDVPRQNADANIGATDKNPPAPNKTTPKVEVEFVEVTSPTPRPETGSDTGSTNRPTKEKDGLPEAKGAAPWEARLERWEAKAEKFQARLDTWEAKAAEEGAPAYAARKAEAWDARLDTVQSRIEAWVDRFLTKTDRKAARTDDTADDGYAAKYATDICDELSTWSVEWTPEFQSPYCDLA